MPLIPVHRRPRATVHSPLQLNVLVDKVIIHRSNRPLDTKCLPDVHLIVLRARLDETPLYRQLQQVVLILGPVVPPVVGGLSVMRRHFKDYVLDDAGEAVLLLQAGHMLDGGVRGEHVAKGHTSI